MNRRIKWYRTMGYYKKIASLLFEYSKRPVMMVRAMKLLWLKEKVKDKNHSQMLIKRLKVRRAIHSNLDGDARVLKVKFPQEGNMPLRKSPDGRILCALYVSYIPTKKRLTLREKKKRLKQAIDKPSKFL